MVMLLVWTSGLLVGVFIGFRLFHCEHKDFQAERDDLRRQNADLCEKCAHLRAANDKRWEY